MLTHSFDVLDLSSRRDYLPSEVLGSVETHADMRQSAERPSRGACPFQLLIEPKYMGAGVYTLSCALK